MDSIHWIPLLLASGMCATKWNSILFWRIQSLWFNFHLKHYLLDSVSKTRCCITEIKLSKFRLSAKWEWKLKWKTFGLTTVICGTFAVNYEYEAVWREISGKLTSYTQNSAHWKFNQKFRYWKTKRQTLYFSLTVVAGKWWINGWMQMTDARFQGVCNLQCNSQSVTYGV